MSLKGRLILGAGYQKLSIRSFSSSAASHLRSGADETTLIVTVVNMYLDRVTDTRFSGQLFRLSGQLLTISRFS